MWAREGRAEMSRQTRAGLKGAARSIKANWDADPAMGIISGFMGGIMGLVYLSAAGPIRGPQRLIYDLVEWLFASEQRSAEVLGDAALRMVIGDLVDDLAAVAGTDAEAGADASLGEDEEQLD